MKYLMSFILALGFSVSALGEADVNDHDDGSTNSDSAAGVFPCLSDLKQAPVPQDAAELREQEAAVPKKKSAKLELPETKKPTLLASHGNPFGTPCIN